MLEERTGPFADADRWASWRWNPAWPMSCLPQREGPAAREAVEAEAKKNRGRFRGKR